MDEPEERGGTRMSTISKKQFRKQDCKRRAGKFANRRNLLIARFPFHGAEVHKVRVIVFSDWRCLSENVPGKEHRESWLRHSTAAPAVDVGAGEDCGFQNHSRHGELLSGSK